jgi:hypothetical protein
MNVKAGPHLAAVTIVLFLSIGCSSGDKAKSGGSATEGVQLGMSIDDAKKQLDGPPETREYSSLPARKKPRDSYPKLPADTQWLVWSGEGKPIVVLGVVGGKVAYKQVIRSEGGQLKNDESALPEYQ